MIRYYCIWKQVLAYLWWMLLGNICLYGFVGYFIFTEMLRPSVKQLLKLTNPQTFKVAIQKHLMYIYYGSENSWLLPPPIHFLLANMFTNIYGKVNRKGVLFILFSWVLLMWMPMHIICVFALSLAMLFDVPQFSMNNPSKRKDFGVNNG